MQTERNLVTTFQTPTRPQWKRSDITHPYVPSVEDMPHPFMVYALTLKIQSGPMMVLLLSQRPGGFVRDQREHR